MNTKESQRDKRIQDALMDILCREQDVVRDTNNLLTTVRLLLEESVSVQALLSPQEQSTLF